MYFNFDIVCILSIFGSRYLDDTINFLLGSLKTTRDKTSTFQAIGLLAISVQDNIVRYLPGILEVIRASLPPKDLPAKYV